MPPEPKGDPRQGLVVMSYGSPGSPDQIEAYYTHIRRGHAPSPEQLAELRYRYEAIGGLSPLAKRSRDQAGAVASALEALEPGRWCVVVGYKHAHPFIEDAVAELAGAGVEAVTGLVLAPHWSAASVGTYHDRAVEAAASHHLVYRSIASWHDEPTWLAFLAEKVRAGLRDLPDTTKVLFTAHSLPERVLEGDPYAANLRESAAAVAGRVGLVPGREWDLVWQSAGRTPEPWRGPDIADALRELAESGQWEGVLVCPQGFVSDHLEILYDLDIDARRIASEVGLAFGRTASLNDDPAVMAALARRVLALSSPVG